MRSKYTPALAITYIALAFTFAYSAVYNYNISEPYFWFMVGLFVIASIRGVHCWIQWRTTSGLQDGYSWNLIGSGLYQRALIGPYDQVIATIEREDSLTNFWYFEGVRYYGIRAAQRAAELSHKVQK